jgi:rhamnosyltransferase
LVWPVNGDEPAEVAAPDALRGLARVRRVVRRALPAEATLLAAGDVTLPRRLAGRRVWSFPQLEDGGPQDNPLADGPDAIARLEALHAAGAEFFLVPTAASDWLAGFPRLLEHLDRAYLRIPDRTEACLIFDLRAPAVGAAQPPPPQPRLLFRGQAHAVAAGAASISVVLVVRDAAESLRALLPRLLSQEGFDEVDFVALDAGSTDATIALLREAGATVAAVGPEPVSPSRARLLAARYATGRLLVFLDPTSVPADDRWLASLVAPLERQRRLAAVCSRILPPPEADLLTYREAFPHPRVSPERRRHVLPDRARFEDLDATAKRRLAGVHLLATAVRADVLARIGFPTGPPPEDALRWAREVLEAGFAILHEPAAVVYRAPPPSATDLLRRSFAEGAALHEVVGEALQEEQLVGLIRELVQADWRRLDQTGLSDPSTLDDWRIRAALRRTIQVVGEWLGGNGARLPSED